MILALVAHVVSYNILEIDGLALHHTMQVEEIEATEHSNVVTMIYDNPTEKGMNVPIGRVR